MTEKSSRIMSFAWFKRCVFDLIFVNVFSITIIYYDFPALSSIIPSKYAAGIPVFIAFMLILLSVFNIPIIGINTLIFIVVIIAYFFLTIVGNSLISEFVLGSSFVVYITLCLLFFLENDIDGLLAHLRVDTFIIGIVYILACFFYSTGRMGGDESPLSYMTLGYGMTFPTMLFFEFYRRNNNKIDLLMAIVLSTLILAFGNRGALIMIALYCIIWTSQVKRKANLKKVIIILFAVLFIVFTLLGGMNYVVGFLANILRYAGLDSRNILKLINGSVLIDQDRNLIRAKAYEMIASNPFAIRGPGALTHEYISDSLVGANAHNMILELWVEYGVIIGSAISLYFYWQIKRAMSMKSYILKTNCGILAFTALFQSLVMLFFSGSLYTCGTLWIGMSVLSACKVRERMQYEYD